MRSSPQRTRSCTHGGGIHQAELRSLAEYAVSALRRAGMLTASAGSAAHVEEVRDDLDVAHCAIRNLINAGMPLQSRLANGVEVKRWLEAVRTAEAYLAEPSATGPVAAPNEPRTRAADTDPRDCPQCGRPLGGFPVVEGKCLCGWPETTPERSANESVSGSAPDATEDRPTPVPPDALCVRCGHRGFDHALHGYCDASRGGVRLDDCEAFVYAAGDVAAATDVTPMVEVIAKLLEEYDPPGYGALRFASRIMARLLASGWRYHEPGAATSAPTEHRLSRLAAVHTFGHDVSVSGLYDEGWYIAAVSNVAEQEDGS